MVQSLYGRFQLLNSPGGINMFFIQQFPVFCKLELIQNKDILNIYMA